VLENIQQGAAAESNVIATQRLLTAVGKARKGRKKSCACWSQTLRLECHLIAVFVILWLAYMIAHN